MKQLRRCDTVAVADDAYRRSDFLLAQYGFKHEKELSGLVDADVVGMTANPVVRSLLNRAVLQQVVLSQALEVKLKADLLRMAHVNLATKQKTVTSGIEAAALMSASLKSDSLEKTRKELKLLDPDRPRPADSIRSLASVLANSREQMLDYLEQRTLAMQAQSFSGSSSSAQAGVRSWNFFASDVLQYGAQTIPPRSSLHVCFWIAACFTNPGTAQNYLTFLRNICTMSGFPRLEWDLNDVKMTIRGLKKWSLRNWGGPSRIMFLLKEAGMAALVWQHWWY